MAPPKNILAFLRWFCKEDCVEEIEGDLTEMFGRESKESPAKANLNFAWRVVKYIRPEYIKSFTLSTQSSSMFQNYFMVAWRNVRHNRNFSSLNIIGLSIGMACCLIIFQFAALESTFDTFHDKKNELYRVLQAYANPNEEMNTGHAYTAQALAPSLKDEVPEIVNITRVHSEEALVSPTGQPDQLFEETRVLYVDPAFLKMFSFPMLSGDAGLARGTVLLSQATATKYFGDTKIEGRSIDVTGTTDKTYIVAGVFKDIPSNSHLQFNMLLPMDDLLLDTDYATEPEGGWSWNNFSTYLELCNTPLESNQEVS